MPDYSVKNCLDRHMHTKAHADLMFVQHFMSESHCGLGGKENESWPHWKMWGDDHSEQWNWVSTKLSVRWKGNAS